MIKDTVADLGLVWPDWQNNIVNVPATLAQYLGKPTNKATLPCLQAALAKNYRNIVYIVIDGMGQHLLEQHLPAASFLRRYGAQTLTSVFPSTTASATTSLLSGDYPAEHGWFAWQVDFDGQVIELFPNRDSYTKAPTADPNFAKNQLPYDYFFADNTTKRTNFVIMPQKVHHHIDVENYQKFTKFGTMCRKIKHLCRQNGEKVIYAYFCDLDNMLHEFGTKSRKIHQFLLKIDKKLQNMLKKCPDTLLIVTADHGHRDVTGFTQIYQDREVMACLAHPISLDPRGACFFVKPGFHQQFEQAFAKYQHDFLLCRSADLILQGLFGKFPDDARHQVYQKRLGDYVAIATNTGKILVFGPGREFRHGNRPYASHHTGLSPDEMLVPLIIAPSPDRAE